MRKFTFKDIKLDRLSNGYYTITELFGKSYIESAIIDEDDEPPTIRKWSWYNSYLIGDINSIEVSFELNKAKYVLRVVFKMSPLTINRMKFLNMVKLGNSSIEYQLAKKVRKIARTYSNVSVSVTPELLDYAFKTPIETWLSSLAMSNVIVTVR